jgi:Protein of unknown function (DUF1588)/Protein of unknown function (DUF1592)/Protein of unknown function (DUF1585)/Protein of unknown function (DUF1595)/Protein of unknown function (DUF1587)
MRQTLGALALLVLGCTANISGNDGKNAGGPGGPGTDPGLGGGGTANGVGGTTSADCKATQNARPVMAARIRRLTRLELENTFADLLGDAARPLARDVETDTFAIGYSTGDERGVSSNYVDALKGVAERAAATLATAAESQALGASCNVDASSAKACARTFLETFGARALRRPLTKSESDGLLVVYEAGRLTAAVGDQKAALSAGLNYAARALLQSSDFIFRTELGAPGAAPGNVALTPFEAAAALSYALTASAPDAELTQKATNGALSSVDELNAQGRRLLEAYPDRFARQAERFVREWMTIDVASPAWSKDSKLYPTANGTFKAALDKETELFLRDWAKAPSFKDLLTSPRGFVSKDNASVYGLSMTSTDFSPVMLDASQRAGILTLPSYLGSRAHTDSSSPVLRGIAVMRKFLCLEPPPVPAMVPPLPPTDKSDAKTTRQRFAQHTSLASCAACHQTFDPMGNAFEHYDAIGAYREQENGVPVDSSGALVGTQSSDAPVANAVELSKLLAASPDVHACFVRQAYRFTVGRREAEADSCAIADYTASFDAKNSDLRELMLALVSSPESLQRVASQPDP